MKTHIYNMKHETAVSDVLEDMRKKMANDFGVTLTGNRLTVRWMLKDELVDVHMVITEVTTVENAKEKLSLMDRMAEFRKKYPDIDLDLDKVFED